MCRMYVIVCSSIRAWMHFSASLSTRFVVGEEMERKLRMFQVLFLTIVVSVWWWSTPVLLLPPTKEEVNVFARVCLPVCLLARLLKNACMDLDEMLRVDRCRDMDELINFEPDPDYSPDAGTRLLSPLSYTVSAAMRNFNSGKIRHICIGRCSEVWFYNGFIHWAVSCRNTFVGGTCAPPSALLVLISNYWYVLLVKK